MLTLTRENGTRPCLRCGKWLSVYVLHSDNDTAAQTKGICQQCIDDAAGPGKFESYGSDHESLAIALTLYAMSCESSEDEFMHDGSGNYCARFENCLLIEDDRGFVTYEQYPDEEKAQKAYDAYFASGWGADEDDIYVDYDRHPTTIWESGKKIPCPPNASGNISDNRIDAAINLHMAKTGYYPNVWDNHQYGVTLRKIKMVSWLTA